MVECLVGMHEALGLVSSTGEGGGGRGERKGNEEEEEGWEEEDERRKGDEEEGDGERREKEKERKEKEEMKTGLTPAKTASACQLASGFGGKWSQATRLLPAELLIRAVTPPSSLDEGCAFFTSV